VIYSGTLDSVVVVEEQNLAELNFTRPLGVGEHDLNFIGGVGLGQHELLGLPSWAIKAKLKCCDLDQAAVDHE